jgi:hypothetical protein
MVSRAHRSPMSCSASAMEHTRRTLGSNSELTVLVYFPASKFKF